MSTSQKIDTSYTLQNALKGVRAMMDSRNDSKSADEKFNLALGHLAPIIGRCGPRVQAYIKETSFDAAFEWSEFHRIEYLTAILVFAVRDNEAYHAENGNKRDLHAILGG